jgi:hypothetical protein
MTDSPFLPGTKVQYAWDSTSLGLYKECPRKYYYQMILGYRPKSLGGSPHLRFGQIYHSALESYDRYRVQGRSHDDALSFAVLNAMMDSWDYHDDKPSGPWVSDHSLKNREFLIRSIIWYLEEFADDAAHTVILANGKPAVELSFRMELDSDIMLCGHLDRVVEFAGDTYVMDRKTTTTTLSQRYFDQYNPDNQMSLYTVAAKVIYNTPVKGVIIDAAQIAVGFTRFSRGFTFRTEGQIEEWLAATKGWIVEAQERADGSARNILDPLVWWPQNEKACGNYGGCPFRSVCSRDPRVRQNFLESNFEVNPWNPLAAR